MILSDTLARRYGKYRLRFLEGPKGSAYQGQTFSPNPFPYQGKQVPGENVGDAVEFLRRLDDDPEMFGTYTIASQVLLDSATGNGIPEQADITGMKHGDNILYASWAFLTFVCEYLVTLDLGALENAHNLLISFQRLGRHTSGYREEESGHGPPSHAGAPFGYMLRGDVIDDADETERLNYYVADPNNHRSLEPSPDQYTSLICTCAIAERLLREADTRETDPNWKTPEQVALRTNVLDLIRERVETCHNYVANNCRYLLKRKDGLALNSGPFAWQFAYPLAKVVAGVLRGDHDQQNFRDYLAPFLVEMLPDILTAFIPGTAGEFAHKNAEKLGNLIEAATPSAIFDKYVKGVLDAKLHAVTQTVLGSSVSLLDFITDHGGDILDKPLSEIQKDLLDAVTKWVTDKIIDPLIKMIEKAIQDLLDAGGDLDREASIIFSKFLFRVFAGVVFDQPLPTLQGGFLSLKDNYRKASLLRDLKLIDTTGLANKLDFLTIHIPLKTKKITQDITVGGHKIGELEVFPEIDWGSIDFNPVDVPFLDWDQLVDLILLPIDMYAGTYIYIIAEALGWTTNQINQAFGTSLPLDPFDAGYMPFGYFLFSVTADLFSEGAFDSVSISTHFRNALFMALDHLLRGLSASNDSFQTVMRVLDQAPDTFPNGLDPNFWNQDFRWLRSEEATNDFMLYSGLDFMSAVMVAAAANPLENRQKVRDAILAGYEFDVNQPGGDVAGVFRFPFRGPISVRQQILGTLPPALADEKILAVGVIFNDVGRTGKVVLELDGQPQEFHQEESCRMVVVKLSSDGVWMKSAGTGVYGTVIIAPIPGGS